MMTTANLSLLCMVFVGCQQQSGAAENAAKPSESKYGTFFKFHTDRHTKSGSELERIYPAGVSFQRTAPPQKAARCSEYDCSFELGEGKNWGLYALPAANKEKLADKKIGDAIELVCTPRYSHDMFQFAQSCVLK